MNVKFILILGISFIILTFHLGSWGLTESSEARYAEISKEMLEHQDYLHPKLMDIYHYHKPPLTYWITTVGYKLFGINEFGARFFLQVAIIFQLVLVYHISLLLFQDKSLSLAASLIYFSLPIVLISSRNLTTDAYLCTFVLASIYSWLKYRFDQKVLFLYLFYVFMALAFETKGPVGLLFVITFMGIYLIVTKAKVNFKKHHAIGLTLFLVLSAAWFITVTHENPRLSNYFINKQVVNRVASNSFHRGKPFWFYLVTLPLIGAPWIIIIAIHYKNKYRSMKVKQPNEAILLLTTGFLIVLFSIFKTKLVLYILPLFGFVAILAARILTQNSATTLKIYNRTLITLSFFLIVSSAVINFLGLGFSFQMKYGLLLLTLVLSICLLILKTNFNKLYLKTAYLSFLFGVTLLLTGNQFLQDNESHLNSFKPASAFINSQLKDTKNIVVYDYLLPSAMFYTSYNVITLNNGRNTVNREVQFEDNTHWKQHFIDIRKAENREYVNELLQDKSVLVTRDKNHSPQDLEKLTTLFQHKKAFKNWIIYY